MRGAAQQQGQANNTRGHMSLLLRSSGPVALFTNTLLTSQTHFATLAMDHEQLETKLLNITDVYDGKYDMKRTDTKRRPPRTKTEKRLTETWRSYSSASCWELPRYILEFQLFNQINVVIILIMLWYNCRSTYINKYIYIFNIKILCNYKK